MIPLKNDLKFAAASNAVQGIKPQSVNNATVDSSAYYSTAGSHQAIAVFTTGTMTGGALNCRVMQAQDTSGTNAKVISGLCVTFAGTGGNTTQTVSINPALLDTPNSFNCLGLQIVESNTCASLVSGLLILGHRRYNDATQAVAT